MAHHRLRLLEDLLEDLEELLVLLVEAAGAGALEVVAGLWIVIDLIDLLGVRATGVERRILLCVITFISDFSPRSLLSVSTVGFFEMGTVLMYSKTRPVKGD